MQRTKPYNEPKAVDFAIAASASLSAGIRIPVGYTLAAVQMPAEWTAANLTFQSSVDNSTFQNVYDDAGNEVTITAAEARYIVVTTDVIRGATALKLRSGTSGTAVNQAAARTVQLVFVPLY